VIFSDASGRTNVRRAFAFSRSTAIINDIPSEARFEPSEWGTVVFQ
jgi:hypothetical protein